MSMSLVMLEGSTMAQRTRMERGHGTMIRLELCDCFVFDGTILQELTGHLNKFTFFCFQFNNGVFAAFFNFTHIRFA